MRTAIKAAPLCGAQVRASVKRPGLAPETTTMEPMTINRRARFEQRIY